MTSLKFEGNGSEFFKIWIVNILLTVLTLGIYYPWAKVRTKRYFYANTSLYNRYFEYHATGRQLFVGFLIAFGFLLLYILLEKINPILALFSLAILFLMTPWIIYRSLKFNLRMVSFSNVRFSFKGKVLDSFKTFLFYPLFYILIYIGVIGLFSMVTTAQGGTPPLLVIIFGFISTMALFVYATAFTQTKAIEYIYLNINYGQGKFSGSYEIKEIISILFKTFLISLALFVVLLFIVGFISSFFIGLEEFKEIQTVLMTSENQSLISEKLATIMPILIILYMGLFVVGVISWAYYKVKKREYILKKWELDKKIIFSSTLTINSFVWVMISNFFLTIISLGFAYPWAKVRMSKLLIETIFIESSIEIDEYITEKEEEQSALGEQVGDAFDVDTGLDF